MKKVMTILMLLVLQVALVMGTANAEGNLHFGYLDNTGAFVADPFLWNNELRPIPSDAAAFQIQGAAKGNLVDPVELFVGIANEGSGFVVPDITSLVKPTLTMVPVDVKGTYKASLTSSSSDAYTLLGLGDSTNNSQNWSNWSDAYSSLIASMPSTGSFGIFEYDLNGTGLVGKQIPIGVIFSGDLPAGTFMFGWAQFEKTNGHTTITDYTTPFTETGMTPSSIPEPTTMLLFGLGLIGLAGVRRKFQK